MPHPLDEWLPNDAPWATLLRSVLRKQCAIRNLSIAGIHKDLVQRLLTYGQADPNTSAIKRRHPWLTEPVDRTSYQAAALDAENARFPLVRVVDNPGRKRDGLERNFQLYDWKNTQTIITVSIDTVVKCDCPMDGPCVHTIYVLRFVLNCPEPYRWQRALLPSELQTIYQHSHAIRAIGPNHPEPGNDFCILCFKKFTGMRSLRCCKKCKRGRMHPMCRLKAEWVKPERKGTCWICYEDIEWDIEKFCWNNRVLPAAPSTEPAVPAQAGPVADAIQESIERKEPEDKQPNNTPSINRRLPSSLSSSSFSSSSLSSLASTFKQQVPSSAHRHGKPPREGKTKVVVLQLPGKGMPPSTSIQSNESIPLPGNPALIWQEMREQREQREQSEKQQHEKARQQAALPKPSAALPTLNPGGGEPSEVTVSPDAASIPAGDHTSPRTSSSTAQALTSPAVTASPQHNQGGAASIPTHDASIANVVSQAPQGDTTTASSTEHAGATGGQHTASTPAGDNPASVSTHAPSGTHTSIDHAKAMALTEECSRLAKKSALIRKKSEREAKRMEKKHKRELKKMTKMEKKHRRELKKITEMEKKHRRELKEITEMEKKHRRELKKTKRKSKQEVKRLEKNIESLEKEVLKALARPEVAEGAAA